MTVKGNYTAFYVKEPFNESNLGANQTPDFIYYNMLRMWKGADPTFPFIDSHQSTYNVRDDSNWETTLIPRLHERLRNSKNIILFLSSNTQNSRTLREEIDYGINTLNLPVITIYPDYKNNNNLFTSLGTLKSSIHDLWDKLPIYRDSMKKVATVHLPLNKELIRRVLLDDGYTDSHMYTPNLYCV